MPPSTPSRASAETSTASVGQAPTATNERYGLPRALRHTADIVLLSSDGARFPAHKSYLAASSAFFAQMFDDEMSDGDQGGSEDELPTVQLSEDKDTLACLLPCIYPGSKQRPPSLRVLLATLAAANKYDIPSARDSMRPHLIWPEFLNQNPLLVYSVSRALQYEPEEQLALETLYKLKEEEVLVLDMEGVRAADLAAVQRKRVHRANKIVKTVNDVLAWDAGARTPANCYRPVCPVCKQQPIWVYIWTKRMMLEVRKRPMLDKAFSFTFLEGSRLKTPRCRCTPDMILWDVRHFEELKKRVEEALKSAKARPQSSLRK